MCTALSFIGGRRFLARNLDHTDSFSEGIAVLPRGYRHPCEIIPTFDSRYAIVGIASVIDGEPLIFDGMNEHGLAIAGLNLPYSTRLFRRENIHSAHQTAKPTSQAKDSNPKERHLIPSFDFMRRILAAFGTVSELRENISSVSLTDEPPRIGIPSPTLHYLVSDGVSSLTLEHTDDKITVYDNPLGVLTNEPPFPCQLSRLESLLPLSPTNPPPRILSDTRISPLSEGLGAVGLPGDFSSPSRFLRAAYIKEHLPSYSDISSTRVAIFELLDAVSIPDGAVDTGGGRFMRTRYSSIMDQSTLTYLVRTPECKSTHTLTLTDRLACAPKPLFCPLEATECSRDVTELMSPAS